MRKTQFEPENYYHIYNRGVDKRSIFQDKEDLARFLECMNDFNTEEATGGLFQLSFTKDKSLRGSTSKLVRFVSYCLNQNHYHFILEPLVQDGIQKFMHRIATGYTMFFNEKYDRSGALFQGRYKSVHVENNAYLLHLSVYVNLNNRVHLGLNEPWIEELQFSSFKEYSGVNTNNFCEKGIILDQFNSREDYLKYAEDTLPGIIKRKQDDKSLKYLLIE